MGFIESCMCATGTRTKSVTKEAPKDAKTQKNLSKRLSGSLKKTFVGPGIADNATLSPPPEPADIAPDVAVHNGVGPAEAAALAALPLVSAPRSIDTIKEVGDDTAAAEPELIKAAAVDSTTASDPEIVMDIAAPVAVLDSFAKPIKSAPKGSALQQADSAYEASPGAGADSPPAAVVATTDDAVAPDTPELAAVASLKPSESLAAAGDVKSQASRPFSDTASERDAKAVRALMFEAGAAADATAFTDNGPVPQAASSPADSTASPEGPGTPPFPEENREALVEAAATETDVSAAAVEGDAAIEAAAAAADFPPPAAISGLSAIGATFDTPAEQDDLPLAPELAAATDISEIAAPSFLSAEDAAPAPAEGDADAATREVISAPSLSVAAAEAEPGIDFGEADAFPLAAAEVPTLAAAAAAIPSSEAEEEALVSTRSAVPPVREPSAVADEVARIVAQAAAEREASEATANAAVIAAAIAAEDSWEAVSVGTPAGAARAPSTTSRTSRVSAGLVPLTEMFPEFAASYAAAQSSYVSGRALPVVAPVAASPRVKSIVLAPVPTSEEGFTLAGFLDKKYPAHVVVLALAFAPLAIYLYCWYLAAKFAYRLVAPKAASKTV